MNKMELYQEAYREGLSDLEAARKLGVARHTFYYWRRRNNLPANHMEIIRDNRLELLRLGYTDKEISLITKKEPSTIRCWRQSLGLAPNKKPRFLDERLKYYNQNLTDYQISNLTGVEANAIRNWRKYYGLPRHYKINIKGERHMEDFEQNNEMQGEGEKPQGEPQDKPQGDPEILNFLNTLRQIIAEKGITQKQLAKGMGISPSNMVGWLKENAKYPPRKTKLTEYWKQLEGFLDRGGDSGPIHEEVEKCVTKGSRNSVAQTIQLLATKRQQNAEKLEKLRKQYSAMEAEDQKLESAMKALKELIQR